MSLKAGINKIEAGGGVAVIVSSPSGGGKTTVVNELLKKHSGWQRSVSATTRAPRPGEQDGKDYIFLNTTKFDDLKAHDGLLEYAQVYQNQYGTPRSYVEKQLNAGHVVFLTVDVQGAAQIKQLWHDKESLLSVFIMPVSMDILRERLLKRNTEKPEQVEVRLAAARQEIEQARFYDFTVYNHSLEQTVGEIERLILNQVQKRRSE